jgi:hypothetical protein
LTAVLAGVVEELLGFGVELLVEDELGLGVGFLVEAALVVDLVVLDEPVELEPELDFVEPEDNFLVLEAEADELAEALADALLLGLALSVEPAVEPVSVVAGGRAMFEPVAELAPIA